MRTYPYHAYYDSTVSFDDLRHAYGERLAGTGNVGQALTITFRAPHDEAARQIVSGVGIPVRALILGYGVHARQVSVR